MPSATSASPLPGPVVRALVLLALALCSGCEFLERAGLGDVLGPDVADTSDVTAPDTTTALDAVVVEPRVDAGSGPPVDDRSAGCGMDGIETAVWSLADGARADAGLGALACDAALAAAAHAHSDDMCRRGYFDHASPEGDGPRERVERAGGVASWVGENIAAGYLDASSVHQGWMTSPGHRANILGDEYGRIGIGRVECGSAGPIWTQVFSD